MAIKLQEINLYSKGYIVEFDDRSSILQRTPVAYVSSVQKDVAHTVIQGDTIYAIADRYYKSDKWWHVIADVNNIINPFDLIIGSELLIPDLDVIKSIR